MGVYRGRMGDGLGGPMGRVVRPVNRASPYGGRLPVRGNAATPAPASAWGTRGRGGLRISPRLIIALVIGLFALVSYFGASSTNPVTGQSQRVALSVDQEIALGLQAAPEMAQQHGGLDTDPRGQAIVDRVGQRLLAAIDAEAIPWKFEFHLLADPQTVNAFALPGGQVFITRALFDRLETEGQLAGVLGHEIGHVIERHGAQRLAKQKLTQGLVGAVGVAGTDPNHPELARAAMMAAAVGQLVNLKYGRDDELESDGWGVALTSQAGYDPRAMIRVMEILAEAGGGGGRQPEFFATHPNPENRIGRIREAIAARWPGGVPAGLEP